MPDQPDMTVPTVIAILGPMIDTPRQIEPTSRLAADLGLDPLDCTVLALELEDAFDCDDMSTEAETWTTVADIIATVQRMTGVPA